MAISPEEHQFRIRLGERFRKVRKHRKMKVVDVAEKLGIPRQSLYHFEKTGCITPFRFLKLCQVYGICANTMLGRKRKKSKKP